MDEQNEPKTAIIAESDDCFAYTAEEPDGELTYHLQINNVTMHFFMEEWQNTLDFLKKVVAAFSEEE